MTDDPSPVTYALSEQQCLDLWDKGETKYEEIRLKGIPEKETNVLSLIGVDIGSDGFCITSKGKSLVYKGHIKLTWEPVTELTNIRGKPARRSIEGMTLSWSSSMRSSSTRSGIIVLINVTRTANCSWHSVYHGDGTEIETGSNATYIVVPKLSSGFQLLAMETICQLSVWRTDDPSVFIVDTTTVVVAQASETFSGRILSLVSSSILGLSLTMQMKMAGESKAIMTNQCIPEGHMMKTILKSTKEDPSYAGYSLMKERGWLLIPAGEAVSVKRCK